MAIEHALPGQAIDVRPLEAGLSTSKTTALFKSKDLETRKREFLDEMVRYRGLVKNTAQIVTLFALSNLWMARRQLIGARG